MVERNLIHNTYTKTNSDSDDKLGFFFHTKKIKYSRNKILI